MNSAAEELAGGKLLANVDDGIGVITFNQPEKCNAMSVPMWAGLDQILRAWKDDSSVRVVVLTGAGEQAFMSGADISEFEKHHGDLNLARDYERDTWEGLTRLSDFPKPVIARIRGYCLGGGLAMAMQADIRIAAEQSEFGIPAARLGLSDSFPAVERLVALVGPAHAAMILYTGERIGSAEAVRIGLVNRVVPNEQLVDSVAGIARMIAENAPLSIAASKLTIEQALRDPSQRDLDAIHQARMGCFSSDDSREGRTAFLEKRLPRFRGR